MNLSMRWLRDYVDINKDMDMREFCEAMTMSGSKVEGYEKEGAEVSGVVVGEILSVDKVENSDKLVVCQVNVGQEAPVQIVTGANNVFPGAKVPVALHGATLPGGVKIKRGKLRGVESNGMLCSIAELGVTVHDFPYAIEDGIFILQEPCEVGQDIHSAIGLDDVSVEFEITPNRADCLCVRGLALEASATFGKPCNAKEPQIRQESGDIADYLKVTVENQELCKCYHAKVVKNVKIEPSPRWLRERLRASGVRPINNLVDITNYVMLEYGNPMHAFDLRTIAGGEIVVRNAREGERIVTLDGVERVLSPEMLVICDKEKPSAVAGVMGGVSSGIMDDTTTVVFEAACFDGKSVRLTSRKLGLRSESSARFEKGLDPNQAMPALMRACELVEELHAGEVVGGVITNSFFDGEKKKITLDSDWINAFLGLDIPKEEMVRILRSLAFEVDGDVISVPTNRTDVETLADIAEEVVRIYGYNRVPSTALRGSAQARPTPAQKFESLVHDAALAMGCFEVQTYSFVSPKSYDKIRMPADSPLRRCVEIRNPLGEDTSVMRTTTIPSMLDVIAFNYNNRNPEGRFYEIGNEYIPHEDPSQLPDENAQLTIGLYGGDNDFYTLKGMAQSLLTRAGVRGWEIEPCADEPAFHPGRCGVIYAADGTQLGIIGEIHPLVADNFSIGGKCYVGRFPMAALMAASDMERKYVPLPRFPATTRDLSLLCDADLPVGHIEKAIRQAVGAVCESVKLFDVYQGAQIEAGKKSVSFSIVMRSREGTLTDEQADNAVRKVLSALEKMGVSLRAAG